MSRSDRRDRETAFFRAWGATTRRAISRGVSPPAGGELLCPWRQSNQNATGDAADGHFVPIGPLSPDPVYGGYPSGWAVTSRRAKFEWLSAIPSGPLGPGSAKIAAGAIQLPRLALPSKRSRCWIRRRGGCPHPPASLPLPPITVAPPLGGQCPSGAQNLSGFPRFPPGHRALGLQNLPLVRFHFRAWLCRANVPGAGYAVGAGALTRPPFLGIVRYPP